MSDIFLLQSPHENVTVLAQSEGMNMARNAPGKHCRKGLSLVEITRMFPDDEAARAWIEGIRWPEGPRCPHCESDRIQHPVAHKTMTHRCRACRKRFSVRTGTPMQSSKLDLQIWVLAVYLLNTCLKGSASMKLHRDLGVTQKTAWHLAHRIRESWDGAGGLFSGPVETDETHIGGKRKNMSNAKRKELAEAGAGRGTVGKAAVVGVKDRASNRVSAQRVSQTDASALQGFVRDHAAPGATLCTDEASACRGMPEYVHEAVNHGVGEFVRGQAHCNGMESFWSLLKRGCQGTFHKFSEKHLDRYVREFAGRHNIRPRDTLDMMQSVVISMAGKRLRCKDLIADNGFPSGARPGA